MNFDVPEEHEALRSLAREILQKELSAERRKQVEADPDRFDRALWRELAKAQLLGAALPESAGGSGYGFLALCLLLEEIGRAAAPVPAHAALAMGALPVAEFGSEAQRRRLLPGVVEGDTILTAALVESGAAEPEQVFTSARRDGEGWRLWGQKTCVPAAHLAARVLLPAQVESDGPAAGGGPEVALFLLDPRADGVELERQETTSGEPQLRISIEDARVPEADVLGDPERGAEILAWTLQRATAAVCALQVGVADEALRLTAEYTRERRQFGRPIGSFQAVHQRAGDAYIQLRAMRLAMLQAAWRLDAGLPAEEEVAVAKYWAAEGGHFIGYAAQHLHGGIGLDVDYPVSRYFLLSKQNELALGSATHQLVRLGASLAARGAPGDA